MGKKFQIRLANRINYAQNRGVVTLLEKNDLYLAFLLPPAATLLTALAGSCLAHLQLRPGRLARLLQLAPRSLRRRDAGPDWHAPRDRPR
ncbi:MAG: hypothetical protein EOO61_09780 [Hymenobacter sp.]|nr:MAG: hypothetical protein EOO61_09780 [Hymenobacter sp.]